MPPPFATTVIDAGSPAWLSVTRELIAVRVPEFQIPPPEA
jgi:hypothetical protein